jgi:Zn-dependent M16 (insulinase) family peptidase
MIVRVLFTSILFSLLSAGPGFGLAEDLSTLKRDQLVANFRVANLYTDSADKIVGAKFQDVRSGAPVYVFQIETAPQTFMWIDAPDNSNRGLPHSLEHLLAGKGTRGRYVSLLKDMRLSQTVAASPQGYNFYALASGTGMAGFFEQFHAWLDALYKPDFTDLEAEWEFYHFGISSDPATKRLIEKGSVYDEMQTGQGLYTYYFELNKRVFGANNPFAFYAGGVPDEMRHVTPEQIRRFHAEHYRLGPTTGFIFVIDPHENVARFLRHVAQEFREFWRVDAGTSRLDPVPEEPKYPIQPSVDTQVGLYPFPSSSEADRGEVRLAWKATKTDSQTDLKMLQLFFRALADGDKSLLYKSLVDSKTRAFDWGVTNVESKVFLENSPCFPVAFVGLSGIPGNRITVDTVEQLRTHIVSQIEEVSGYPDNSPVLAAFNHLVESYADAWRRSENVWVKSAPLFGSSDKTDWKEHLNYLEIDPSFIRSLSEESVWRDVGERLKSGTNVWHGVIQRFHLLDVPYATASVPSPQLFEQMEKQRQTRIEAKIKELTARFGVASEQEALSRFEEQEIAKTKEIGKIAAAVPRPHFTKHPPLTLDDGVQYHQLRLEGVPVIATYFERVPTLDVGLSFDLTTIPAKYYKYLPILPRSLDSLGLKTWNEVIPYADLLASTGRKDLSIGYEVNPVSHREDLTIRASAMSPAEFREALALIQRMIKFSDLNASNAERLRDLVDKRLWIDDAFNKRNDSTWFMNPSYAFRYQDDALYLALFSFFTRAHWDSRLKWLLHQPVSSEEIENLGEFAKKMLSSSPHISSIELLEQLSKSDTKGLERELLAYWERNIPAFAETELVEGLRRLTLEVQEDLRAGPAKAMGEIRELQRLVFDREALRIDLTLDEAAVEDVRPSLLAFLRALPVGVRNPQGDLAQTRTNEPILGRAEKRYGLSGDDFPWYVGLNDPQAETGSMVFYADFPGYGQLDRKSLLQVLSSKLVSGTGPHTSFMKSREDGLAYDSSITSDPSLKLIWYYGERSPDPSALLGLVNSIAENITGLSDGFLVDYALQQTFAVPRLMSTFSERGRGLAQDIRDGNDPETVRRFSQGILQLRKDPELLSELTRAGLNSINPVLAEAEFKSQQRKARSLFFFVGPERILSETEKRLPAPRLLRLYPSDFWIDFSRSAETK